MFSTQNISSQKLPPKSLINGNPQANILSESLSKKNSISNSNVSTGQSKLHQYFSSSQFLSSQQQLSVFIQNFPIIDLQSSHKSINQIIPLLIRQNQLLGKKCQSQILLIKQSFTKHEGINKQMKKTKQQTQKMQEQCRQIINKKQAQCVNMMRKCDKLQQKIKAYSQYIIKQNQIMKCIITSQFKKCEELTNQRKFRIAYEDFFSQFNDSKKHQQKSINEESKSDKRNSQMIVGLQKIQKYCKQTRKRYKYYSKVKTSVQQFCNRLVKICSIIPPELIIKEFQHQCQQFLSLFSQLIGLANGQTKKSNKKRKQSESGGKDQIQQSGSQKYGLSNVHSQSSLINRLEFQNSNRLHYINQLGQYSKKLPFQTLIGNYMAQKTTKSSQRIKQLEQKQFQLQKQLSTSKDYYESYLINLKMEYEQQKRQLQQQITIKDEMIKHFEQQLQKSFNIKQQYSNKISILTRQNEQMKEKQKPLEQQIQLLKKQIESNQASIQKAISKNNELQEQLQKQLDNKQQQFNTQIQKLQTKLKSQEQKYQENLKRKQQKIQEKQKEIEHLKTQVKLYKQTVQDKQIQINRITKRLHVIEEDQVKKLENQVGSIEAQINQTKRLNKQLMKNKQQLTQQLALNTSYVQQLQMKIAKKEQTIQKLNKKLSSIQIDRKSSKVLKQENQKLQKQIQLLSIDLKKSYEQSNNLKRLVKQMKKQLQQVYHTINDLKSIQKDRQRLLIENQKSQRWKQQIMKDYDQMKYEILKVQSQNKNLALEVKHYKNALKRIQMIN